MFDWLKGLFAGRPQKESVNKALMGRYQDLRARYDAAQTSSENNRLWLQTDVLSARSANSFEVRRVLRMRSRYEIANNSYARGITLTLANDLIGTGPRLNMRMPDEGANTAYERAFAQWCRAVNLAEKLRTMKLAKTGDGEAFALFVTNSDVDSPVQLDLQLIEADQVTTPNAGFGSKDWVDGVVLDKLGNVTAYNVLRQHPGDLFMRNFDPMDFATIPKRNVLHWLRKDRPGQVRGIPEFTPSLELFAKLRRFGQATLEAAEIVADFAAVLQTNSPADTDTAEPSPFDTAKIERGMFTQLPWNTTLSQLKPEQPTTNHEMYVRVILREIARCLNIPYSIAAGDYSNVNFSSGRLEHLTYHRAHKVERAEAESMMDRIFYAWLDEAVMIPRYLPKTSSITEVEHRWFWDPLESIDPVKDATATQINLASNLTTLEEEYARLGEEWEPRVKQRGKEVALMVSLGITPEQPKPQHGMGLNEGAPVQDQPPTKATYASYVADMDSDEDSDVNTRTLLQIAQIFAAAHQPGQVMQPVQAQQPVNVTINNQMPTFELKDMPTPVVNVHVEPTPINVQASPVPVNVMASPATVHVDPTPVTVPVNVQPAAVNVQAAPATKQGKRKVKLERDGEGNVIGADVESN